MRNVPATPLSPSELRIAAAMLSRAKDEFTNHGCNDVAWPDWFPQDERYPFAFALHAALGDLGEAHELASAGAEGKLAPMDWELMLYLSARLEASAKAPAWHKVADEPPPEHEMVLLSWGVPEGSVVGYRRVRDGDEYYCVGGDTHDGDFPVWWMRLPGPPPRE